MKKKHNKFFKNYKKVAEDLIERLNKLELGAYIYHIATTGSVYIRFSDPKLCSIRIGDHDGREKYKYKWNFRSDIQTGGWKNENGTYRYYCPFHQQYELIEEILKRKELTKDWSSQYEYSNPKFNKFEAK